MNKLYAIQYFIKGNYICEFWTYNLLRFETELEDKPEAYLTEDNAIHTIYRIDV